MPRDFSRSARLALQIKRELATAIQTELKDPRVGFITLTDVDLSPDLKHAKVYFTLLNPDEAALAQALRGLKNAAGFLRTELAHRMKMRSSPHLQFFHDTSVERGMRLSTLIDKAVSEEGGEG